MARPASSTPTRRPLLLVVTLCLAVAAAVGTYLLAAGRGESGTVTEGTALDGGMQSAGDVGYEHAQVGEEYWAGLPLVWNESSRDLAISKAEFVHVPEGLEVLEYRALDGDDTDGNILFARTDGKGGMGDLTEARNYAGTPVKVKAKSGSDVYYIARVKVTGPIHADLTGCRYWYRQGAREYRQDVDCSTIIRLGPPLTYED